MDRRSALQALAGIGLGGGLIESGPANPRQLVRRSDGRVADLVLRDASAWLATVYLADCPIGPWPGLVTG